MARAVINFINYFTAKYFLAEVCCFHEGNWLSIILILLIIIYLLTYIMKFLWNLKTSTVWEFWCSLLCSLLYRMELHMNFKRRLFHRLFNDSEPFEYVTYWLHDRNVASSRPCHSSGSGFLGSSPGEVICDLWWTKWHDVGFAQSTSVSHAKNLLITLSLLLYGLNTDSVVK